MAVNEQGRHGIAAYNRGCRCDVCRAASAAARRRQRAAKPDAPKGSPNVVALPNTGQPVHQPGPNELAVLAEVELLPRSAERPAIVQAALTVARRLDDEAHAAMTARNAHELRDLLDQLKGPKRKSAGRLQIVSAMAGRKAAHQ